MASSAPVLLQVVEGSESLRQCAQEHGREEGRHRHNLHGARGGTAHCHARHGAKIGAIHSVVYGGFSEQALADRITDAQSRVVITCDGAWLRGKTVNLKEITDEAVARGPVVQRGHRNLQAHRAGCHHAGRGAIFWWHDLMALPIASPQCETEVMDAEDPLFILYTSGTTGKPKGLTAHLWRRPRCTSHPR